MTSPSGAETPHDDHAEDATDAAATGDAVTDDAANDAEPDLKAEFARQFSQAAERSGLGALARDEQLTGRDVLAAVGGVRGILEALLPGLVFLVVYSVLTSFAGQGAQAALVPALVASVGLAIVFTAARVIAKGQPTQAIAGLVGVLLSAALALWSGDARDNYVLGFFTNAGYALALLVSVFVRWPAIGLIVGFLVGDGTAWRAERRKVRLAQFLTLAWVGFFVLRLVVQVPLYLVDNVQALGLTRLLMGVPLYALMLVFTWLVVRAAWASKPAAR
ncbi:DUF3159 domain-containing protein [Agromyces sp. CFH 90414]|uniref:DUF3159 domain-containing protein n=1 Tax=Agromyces agglutinans TaxID=2662258 RepID=A0A6I2FBQ3_9MICO|nr:DUF3159 domain-containing protein [Agromyces agglutinans]MRG58598.1 DUF3159 domain-containing protein [Agromyces agglutinans]